jgi:hypothetical protein
MRVTRGVVGVGIWAVLGLVGRAEARGEERFGAHVAYYSEFERVAVGLSGRTFFSNSWSVGILGDYVLRPDHSTWVFELDAQRDIDGLVPRIRFWAGIGGGVLVDDVSGKAADVDPVGVLYLGAGYTRHPIVPYVELRFVSHEVFHGVLYVGVRF